MEQGESYGQTKESYDGGQELCTAGFEDEGGDPRAEACSRGTDFSLQPPDRGTLLTIDQRLGSELWPPQY